MRFLFTSYAKHPRSLESIATLQLVRLQSGDTKAWISINNASSSLHMLMQTPTHTYTHTHTHTWSGRTLYMSFAVVTQHIETRGSVGVDRGSCFK